MSDVGEPCDDRLFDTEHAATYLGVTTDTIKHYVYRAKTLRGQLIGGALVFTGPELDKFKTTKAKPGRPSKS